MVKLDIIALKLFGFHFVITFFSIFLLSFFSETESNLALSIFFGFIQFLYFLSGYLITNKKIKWYNYFSIAIFGFLFWLICFINSPESTHYKMNSNAGPWIFYEIYIMSKSPLYFIEPDKYSLKFDLLQKFVFPFIFSLSQFFGGIIKMRSIKNAR